MKGYRNVLNNSVMGLAIIFLTLGPASAQDTADLDALAEQLPHDMQNTKMVPLTKVLKKIEADRNISFVYASGLMEGKQVPAETLNSPDLAGKLSSLLKEKGLAYHQQAKGMYVIQRLDNKANKTAVAEQITGTVTDAQTEETLPGVNILVKGTSTGASTDANGQYELEVESLQDTLVVSFVGYKTQQVPIDGRTKINVALQSQAISGEEMVVVGYGEQTKETITTSITSIKGEDIARVHAGDVGNALAGVSPGLQVTQRSGKPGRSTPEIFLRGNADPIYVIDGVIHKNPMDVTQLDPNTIENISVLKDAAATSIYGSEGANGAIVVTTKRGSKGPMHVSITSSVGFQQPVNIPEMTDSYTTARAFNEAEKNDGIPKDERRFSQTVLDHFKSNDYTNIFPNTDWRHYLIKNKSLQTQTNISLSGGTDKLQYFISGGYLKQNGYYKNFSSKEYETKVSPDYNRYNFRANLDIDVTPSTELSLTSSGRIGKRVQTDLLAFDQGSLPFRVLSGSPFSSPGVIDGKLIQVNNVYIPDGERYVNPLKSFYGNGFIEHSKNVIDLQLSLAQQLNALTKGLELEVKGNYNSKFTRNYGKRGIIPTYSPFFLTDLVDNPPAGDDSMVVYRKHGTRVKPAYSENFGKDRSWYVEGRLHYKQNFGPHNVEGLLLYNQRRRYYPNSYPGIPEELVSGLIRLNYNYNRRYLLQFNVNTDGSERFAENQRFGYFPGISAGWILTNEPYIPDLNFLNFLKLRASYGIVGSSKGIERFLYLPDRYSLGMQGYNFGIGHPEDYPGATEGALGNPAATWAQAKKQNYGIDLHLFEDKVQFSFDYFYERRSGLILNKFTPAYVAVRLPPVNAGEVENHGYESTIKWEQRVGDFSYSISGNITFASNKVLYNAELPPLTPWQGLEGRPKGQYSGYKFDGFYTQEDIDNLGNGIAKPAWNVRSGFLKFKDINGDGKIDTKDRIPIGYPSSPPEYAFGSTQHFSYKNIDLTMTWAGATNVSRNLSKAPFRLPFGEKGRAPAMQWQWDGRWTPEKAEEGQKITYPIFSKSQSINGASSRAINNSDFWQTDASYIRLKTIELGYNFSTRFLQQIGLQSLRLYLNGYNLLTFSGMLDKYDIDPGQVGRTKIANYPIMKSYHFGINVKF